MDRAHPLVSVMDAWAKESAELEVSRAKAWLEQVKADLAALADLGETREAEMAGEVKRLRLNSQRSIHVASAKNALNRAAISLDRLLEIDGASGIEPVKQLELTHRELEAAITAMESSSPIG